MSQQRDGGPPPHKRPYGAVQVDVRRPDDTYAQRLEFKYVAGLQVGEGTTTLLNQDMRPIAQVPTDYSIIVWPEHDVLASVVVPVPRPALVVPGPGKLQ